MTLGYLGRRSQREAIVVRSLRFPPHPRATHISSLLRLLPPPPLPPLPPLARRLHPPPGTTPRPGRSRRATCSVLLFDRRRVKTEKIRVRSRTADNGSLFYPMCTVRNAATECNGGGSCSNRFFPRTYCAREDTRERPCILYGYR